MTTIAPIVKARTHLLDIIITQRPPILELLPSKDQTLLVRWDAFLVLDLGFDIVDCVAGLDFEGDSLAGESLDEAVFREGQLVKGGGEGEYLWDKGRVKKERGKEEEGVTSAL